MLTLHSSTQSGVTSTPSHTLLSLSLHSATLRAARQAEITIRLKNKRGKFLTSNFLFFSGANACAESRPASVWVTVANHKRVECHLLVHNLNPLFSSSPPLSLLPQTHWHSTPTHWLTICFYTRTEKITVWVHTVSTCRKRGCTQMLMHAQM